MNECLKLGLGRSVTTLESVASIMNEWLKHIIELNNEHAEAMTAMHIAQTAANEASKDLKNAQNRVRKLTQERTAWLSEMFKDEG